MSADKVAHYRGESSRDPVPTAQLSGPRAGCACACSCAWVIDRALWWPGPLRALVSTVLSPSFLLTKALSPWSVSTLHVLSPDELLQHRHNGQIGKNTLADLDQSKVTTLPHTHTHTRLQTIANTHWAQKTDTE